jgi:MFS family permease
VIWTIGEILVVTNFGVYLADNSPSNFRARFNAIGSLSWSIGAALGTSIAGKFIAEIGLNYIWPLTFVLSLIGIIGMYSIYVKGIRRKAQLIATEEMEKEIA